jgi:1-aminocyclopropane-1-carboxylate deaminase/D-cysteine desulfhydrase-like pyridoxal-dependent ACC family enzyme
MREIVDQLVDPQSRACAVDAVVCASGSGGTLCGLSLGALYAQHGGAFGGEGRAPKVVGYGVCDTPEWFNTKISGLAKGMQQIPEAVLPSTDVWVDSRQAKGLGYSKASAEELQFLSRVARESGVVLDKAYTNKAAYNMVKDLATGALAAPATGRVLFVHTGGGPSVFDSHQQLLASIGGAEGHL